MPYALPPDGSITAEKLAAGAAAANLADGSVAGSKLATGAALANLADASIPLAKLKESYAVGTVVEWVGTFDASHKPDAGEWMECDGSAISQTTYAALYALFGAHRWGEDAGGNFCLPDAKRRVTLGRDGRYQGPYCPMSTVGGTYVPGCGWCGYTTLGGCEMTYVYTQYKVQYTGTGSYYGTASSSQQVSVMQPYLTVYKLIKVKAAA